MGKWLTLLRYYDADCMPSMHFQTKTDSETGIVPLPRYKIYALTKVQNICSCIDIDIDPLAWYKIFAPADFN